MAIGTRSLSILMNIAAAAVQDGVWYDVDRTIDGNSSAQDAFVLSVAGTTPTVTIEARNHPADTPVQLTTTGVNATLLSGQYRQYRARATAGSNLTVVVSCNRSLVATA